MHIYSKTLAHLGSVLFSAQNQQGFGEERSKRIIDYSNTQIQTVQKQYM